MPFIPIEEAQARLGEIIDQMHAGEEVFITRDDHPVARLVATSKPRTEPRKPGTLRGTIGDMSDFDKPLEEFKEYTR